MVTLPNRNNKKTLCQESTFWKKLLIASFPRRFDVDSAVSKRIQNADLNVDFKSNRRRIAFSHASRTTISYIEWYGRGAIEKNSALILGRGNVNNSTSIDGVVLIYVCEGSHSIAVGYSKQEHKLFKMVTPRKTAHRWDANGPDAIMLRQMMSDGEITESDTPKMVHESRREFQLYNLPQFRGAFNRTKRDVGLHCRKSEKPKGKKCILFCCDLYVVVSILI
jgi:hypothetical protein